MALIRFFAVGGAGVQEGVVQDSKDSPVEAVRAFIKRIAGKE